MGKKLDVNSRLEDIFEETNCLLTPEQLVNITNDEDIINGFIDLSNKENRDAKKLKQFLIDHQNRLNKGKLIVMLVYSYKINIELIQTTIIPGLEAEIKELEKELFNAGKIDDQILEKLNNKRQELNVYKEQLEIQTRCMKNAIRIGRNVDEIILSYIKDENTGMSKIEVVDSLEIIDGKKRSKSNRKRLERIDDEFEKEENSNESESGDTKIYRKRGLDYIYLALLMTDFETFFDYKENSEGRIDSLAKLGDYIRTMILENAVIEEGIVTPDELERMRTEDLEKYSSIIESDSIYQKVVSKIKSAFMEYASYMDIDRMLLISAYRIENLIEQRSKDGTIANLIDTSTLSGEFSEEDKERIACESLKDILEYIRKQLSKDYLNKKHKFRIEPKIKDGYEGKLGKDGKYDIEYSSEDIDRCIDRLAGNEYTSKETIKEIRREVLSGKKYLDEFKIGDVYKAFSDEGIVAAIDLNDRNFMFYVEATNIKGKDITSILIERKNCTKELISTLLEKQRIDIEDIIKLYEMGNVSIDFIHDIKDKYDISSVIKQSELLQTYILAVQKDASEEDALRYKKYLKLYKEIFVSDRDENEVEDSSQKMIEQLIELDLKENYVIYLEDMYKDGVVTIDSILMWEPETILYTLYKDGLITVDEINQFAVTKKISIEYWEQLLHDITFEGIIKQEELIELLYNGYIDDEELLIRLYREGRIFDGELENLKDLGAISESTYNNIMFELERNCSIGSIDAGDWEEFKFGESDDYDSYSPNGTIDNPDIIDPRIKDAFFELLRFKLQENATDKNDKFYGYDLRRLQDERIKAAGYVVDLAEKSYKDEDGLIYSYYNATVFRRQKVGSHSPDQPDEFMIRKIHNLAELERTETDNEITIDIKKTGSWAFGILFGVIEAIEGHKLEHNCREDYAYVSRKLIEMYGTKQLKKITELAKRIDRGDFNCKIVDGGRTVIPYNPYATEDYLEEERKKHNMDDNGPGGNR